MVGNKVWGGRLRALGPGVLMATAAIGGSHLVASTQAGALFGWQLIWLILLINILKYPFFRFGVEYTLSNNESLLSGYARRGKVYLYSFMLLNAVSAVVNTAGVGFCFPGRAGAIRQRSSHRDGQCGLRPAISRYVCPDNRRLGATHGRDHSLSLHVWYHDYCVGRLRSHPG